MAEKTSEFFLSLPRDQAQAVINARMKRLGGDIRELACDLVAFKGTNPADEMALLREDIRRDLERLHGLTITDEGRVERLPREEPTETPDAS